MRVSHPAVGGARFFTLIQCLQRRAEQIRADSLRQVRSAAECVRSSSRTVPTLRPRAKQRSHRGVEALIRRELLGQEAKRVKSESGRLVTRWINSKDKRWRDRPITGITHRDVVELVENINDRSKAQARKTFRGDQEDVWLGAAARRLRP